MPIDVRRCSLLAVPALLASLVAASPARADSDDGFDKKGDDIIAADKQARDERSSRMPGERDRAAPPPAAPEAPSDVLEDRDRRYYFIGARFRDVIVPQFMINIFADGGATVNVPMGGIEFSTRRNRLEVDLSVQYADYSTPPFLFKGKSEPEDAYELVRSKLKMVLLEADFLRDFPIDDAGHWSFLIGGSVGIGFIFDSLFRSQAYPGNSGQTADPNDPSQWKACTGPSASPTTVGKVPFCDGDPAHAHFGVPGEKGSYEEPGWVNNGSKPLIFPWLAPQLSLRYKPIKQLQLRLDAGFSTSGFFGGLHAGFGL